MIKKTFFELNDIYNPYQATEDLIKINEKIGVKINLIGKLPQHLLQAKVFFEIIREAVTNAIRKPTPNAHDKGIDNIPRINTT